MPGTTGAQVGPGHEHGQEPPAGEALPRGPVRVILPHHDRGLRAHVHEVAGDEVIMDAPVEPAGADPTPVGGQLWLSWTSEGGLHHLLVELRERLDGPPRWRVTAVAPLERQQRREGERVPVMGTVSLRVEGVAHDAQLVDLSAGGLRCLLPPDTPVVEGGACEVGLDVVRPGLEVVGDIVRVREGFDGKTDIAVQFVGVSAAVVDELQRFVLDVQLDHDRLDPW